MSTSQVWALRLGIGRFSFGRGHGSLTQLVGWLVGGHRKSHAEWHLGAMDSSSVRAWLTESSWTWWWCTGEGICCWGSLLEVVKMQGGERRRAQTFFAQDGDALRIWILSWKKTLRNCDALHVDFTNLCNEPGIPDRSWCGKSENGRTVLKKRSCTMHSAERWLNHLRCVDVGCVQRVSLNRRQSFRWPPGRW